MIFEIIAVAARIAAPRIYDCCLLVFSKIILPLPPD